VARLARSANPTIEAARAARGAAPTSTLKTLDGFLGES